MKKNHYAAVMAFLSLLSLLTSPLFASSQPRLKDQTDQSTTPAQGLPSDPNSPPASGPNDPAQPSVPTPADPTMGGGDTGTEGGKDTGGGNNPGTAPETSHDPQNPFIDPFPSNTLQSNSTALYGISVTGGLTAAGAIGLGGLGIKGVKESREKYNHNIDEAMKTAKEATDGIVDAHNIPDVEGYKKLTIVAENDIKNNISNLHAASRARDAAKIYDAQESLETLLKEHEGKVAIEKVNQKLHDTIRDHTTKFQQALNILIGTKKAEQAKKIEENREELHK